MSSSTPEFPNSQDSLAATFLDEHADIESTSNRLPHWQQCSSTIFLTFRLADSIPQNLLRDWEQQRTAWLAANPPPHSPIQSSEYRERFINPFEQMLDDGYGEQHLADPSVRSIVAGALGHFDHERYLLHAYVLMPSHVHVLATFALEHPLDKVVGSWKSFSARRINHLLQRKSPLWQTDFFDRIVRDFDHYENCLNYIARNPVKAKLAKDSFAIYQRENPFFNPA